MVHHAFQDPAKANGTEAEKMLVFRRVRDEIQNWLLPYLKTQ